MKTNNKIENVIVADVIEATNNEIEKVEMTLKELSQKTQIPEGTLRASMMKPIDGIPYSINNINYQQLVKTILKYVPNFTTIHGFEAKKIVIIKAERSTKKWVREEELRQELEGEKMVIHNYSLRTEVKYVGHTFDRATYAVSIKIHLFRTVKGEYKAYTVEELSKENIKLELAQ